MTAPEAGTHVERTLLAWIRTAAALTAGGLGAAGVATRHAGDGLAVIPFLFAALCGAVLLARSGLRHRRAGRALRGGLPPELGMDAVLAWVGVLAVVTGALAFVLTPG